MKLKKISILLVITCILFGISNTCFGAVAIKPSTVASAGEVIINTTANNSYTLCQQMKNEGQSLYGTNVAVHMATNADWGAVSYLSNSVYGTNGAGQNKGTKTTIKAKKPDNTEVEVEYYSTTGNITGVMNWGSNCYKDLWTQTSCLITAYDVDTETNGNLTALINAAKSNDTSISRFVERVDTSSSGFTKNETSGMAFKETQGFYGTTSYFGTSTTYPISVRQGLFRYNVGFYAYLGIASGAEYDYVTFRPVIWNQ